MAHSPRILRVAAELVAAAFIFLFLFTACKRLHYPFELDRMESAMMTTVLRVRHGLPLYSAPSMEWVPFLYAPVYFYISAAVSRVVGLGYPALRLVSILSTLGSFGLIYAFVVRETRNHAAALVSVGIFASLYSFTLAWFDVGRVDSLSVFFLLLALYATRFYNPVIAALIWLLAFQTKQTMLPVALIVFLCEWQRPRRMLLGMATFAALAFASVHFFNAHTGGWYSYYVFGASRGLKLIPHMLLLFFPLDLLGPLGIAVALIAIALFIQPPNLRSRAFSFYAFVTAILTGAICFVRAHDGANINAVIPVYVWLSILLGFAIHRILRWSATALPAGSWLVPAVVWLLVSVQMLGHLYRPAQWEPASLASRNAFMVQLKAIPGDVWATNHSYDALLAGKPMHPEMDALDSVLGRSYQPTIDELRKQIETQHFSAIILDRDASVYQPPWLFNQPPFTTNYALQAVAVSGYSGEADQPHMIYLSCSALTAAVPPIDLKAAFINRGNCPAKNP